MANNIIAKKQAVSELLQYGGKNVLNHASTVAKQHGLKTVQVKRAYINFLNFKKVDLRYKRANATTATGTKVVLPPKSAAVAKSTAQKVAKIPSRPLSSVEWRMLIHEWLITGSKTSSFCIKNKVNLTDFYEVLRELKISGTIKGVLVLDYRKYGKFDLSKVFIYMRAKFRGCSQKYIDSLAKLKNTSEAEWKIIRRISNVLDTYLN